jgi:hypothetical protein
MALGEEKIKQDLADQLQGVSDREGVLVMSFVAPDSIVKKSPVAYDYAKITIDDLYKIEATITKMQEEDKLPAKCHLVIQTPGGSLDAAVKIAKYLQAVFEEIEAYVPYEAASGGTMLCLAANTIVMDLTSDLTPIDPQVYYKGERIAATSYEQAISDFEEKFPTKRPEELPSPYQQMGNTFDPIVLKEMDKIVWDTISVALSLLKKSQKPEKDSDLYPVVLALGKSEKPHSHVISAAEAKEIGLNVSDDGDKIKLLRVYKKWVSSMLNRQETNHIIDVYCPQQKTKIVKPKKSTKRG